MQGLGPAKKRFPFLEHPEETLVKRRFGEGFLVLELGREVDAVVLTDVTDSLWRKLLSLGRDAHGIEDVTTSRQIATEGTG